MAKWSSLLQQATGGGIANYCIAYGCTIFLPTGSDLLPFGSNWVDTASIHSTSVHPTRFTAPKTGFYLVGGQVQIVGNNSGSVRALEIKVNGADPTIFPNHALAAPAASGTSPAFSLQTFGLLPMNAGDYMELLAISDETDSYSFSSTGGCWGAMVQLA